MKIALIAPIRLAIPPLKYGGIEQVVATLADGLVRSGHEVTLFASADSKTEARLVPTWPKALLDDAAAPDLSLRYIYTNQAILGRVLAEGLDQFDAIHSHIEQDGLILSQLTDKPLICTQHGNLGQPLQRQVFNQFPLAHYVAISQSQRSQLPPLNWCGVVYNGVPVHRIGFNPRPDDDYLLFIGRICPEKDPVAAIKLAQATGSRLIIAAKVDPVDVDYFEHEVKPLLKAYPRAEFVGEVDFAAKVKLYQNARATLFPVNWEEPFGLVMVESLSAGTPVIALRRGSVPEIIEDGKSGFIGRTMDDLVKAVDRIDELDRADCRARAEKFSDTRMVEGYLAVYRRMMALGPKPC